MSAQMLYTTTNTFSLNMHCAKNTKLTPTANIYYMYNWMAQTESYV